MRYILKPEYLQQEEYVARFGNQPLSKSDINTIIGGETEEAQLDHTLLVLFNEVDDTPTIPDRSKSSKKGKNQNSGELNTD